MLEVEVLVPEIQIVVVLVEVLLHQVMRVKEEVQFLVQLHLLVVVLVKMHMKTPL